MDGFSRSCRGSVLMTWKQRRHNAGGKALIAQGCRLAEFPVRMFAQQRGIDQRCINLQMVHALHCSSFDFLLSSSTAASRLTVFRIPTQTVAVRDEHRQSSIGCCGVTYRVSPGLRRSATVLPRFGRKFPPCQTSELNQLLRPTEFRNQPNLPTLSMRYDMLARRVFVQTNRSCDGRHEHKQCTSGERSHCHWPSEGRVLQRHTLNCGAFGHLARIG